MIWKANAQYSNYTGALLLISVLTFRLSPAADAA